MAEKRLTLENVEPLLLFGFNDTYLRKIEAAFPETQITARGNQVFLRGEPETITRIERVLDELILILNRNSTLTENDVDTVLALFTVGEGLGRSGPDTRDVVLFTPSGGMVKAKTPNQVKLVQAARNNDILFAIGPAGTGKCVVADTLVLTSEGLVPIEELAKGTLPGAAEERTHTVMGLDGPAQTSHVFNGGLSATLRLVTRHGFEIEGTPEHPLLTLTPKGQYAWKRLNELEVGDYVALQRNTQFFGTQTSGAFTYDRKNSDYISKEVTLKTLDEGFAYFMGLMVGDGCMHKRPGSTTVMLSTADADISAHVQSICGRFGLHGPQFGYDHRINSTQLYALLQHLGVQDVPAHEKRIPHAILRAPKNLVIAFLQGLFDADGTVERRNGSVSLTSASKRLVQEVHLMLLNLGIVASLRSKSTTHHDAFTLEMYGSEADRFFAEIGFRLNRKQSLRRQDRASNPNLDVVPHVASTLDAAVRARTLSRAQHKQFGDYRTGRRKPSYEKLDTLTGLLEGPGPNVDTLRRINADRLLWSQTVQLEAGEGQVYDLTVPAGHNFVAGGFVNHNTYVGVALAVAALKSRQVKRIVLCRPAVEAGERLGFLPGDFREKIDPYLRPLYDALEEMIPREKLRAYLDQNTVEIVPLAYMRGRTLSSAFVILDEAQNATTKQMKMFLTRLGANSRAIITGDATQIDLPSRGQSGLVEARNILEGIDGISFVYFGKEDVVRHRLVQDIIEAYERNEENEEEAAERQASNLEDRA